MEHELQAEYFDVTHAHGDQFHFYEPKLNLKLEPTIDKQQFKVDNAFGPDDHNDKVYV